MSVSFTVYGVAAPAGSKKGFYNAKAGRVIITDDSAKSRPWKALVSDAAIEAMTGPGDDGSRVLEIRPPLEGPLLLELTFWVPRPKGHYGVKGLRPSAPRFPTVKPDLLKLARACEDAMSGVVYRDDAQIVSETLQKAYTSEQARCVVRVVPIRRAAEREEHVA